MYKDTKELMSMLLSYMKDIQYNVNTLEQFVYNFLKHNREEYRISRYVLEKSNSYSKKFYTFTLILYFEDEKYIVNTKPSEKYFLKFNYFIDDLFVLDYYSMIYNYDTKNYIKPLENYINSLKVYSFNTVKDYYKMIKLFIEIFYKDYLGNIIDNDRIKICYTDEYSDIKIFVDENIMFTVKFKKNIVGKVIIKDIVKIINIINHNLI